MTAMASGIRQHCGSHLSCKTSVLPTARVVKRGFVWNISMNIDRPWTENWMRSLMNMMISKISSFRKLTLYLRTWLSRESINGRTSRLQLFNNGHNDWGISSQRWKRSVWMNSQTNSNVQLRKSDRLDNKTATSKKIYYAGNSCWETWDRVLLHLRPFI